MKNSFPETFLSQCPQGHVLLQVGMTTLHLTIEQLRSLSQSAQDFLRQADGQTAKESEKASLFSPWKH